MAVHVATGAVIGAALANGKVYYNKAIDCDKYSVPTGNWLTGGGTEAKAPAPTIIFLSCLFASSGYGANEYTIMFNGQPKTLELCKMNWHIIIVSGTVHWSATVVAFNVARRSGNQAG